MDPEAQLGYLFVLCADQLSRTWHGALRTAGINPRQFSMLAVLAREPGISQAALARQVMITAQSAGESLQRLTDSELIARVQTSPGRSAQLQLTEAGRALLVAAYPIVERVNEESFAALSDRERRALMTMLRKLLASAS